MSQVQIATRLSDEELAVLQPMIAHAGGTAGKLLRKLALEVIAKEYETRLAKTRQKIDRFTNDPFGEPEGDVDAEHAP